MKPKPIAMPSMCGIVRRKPHSEPDEASIALFGPGVADIEVASADATQGPLTATTSTDWERLIDRARYVTQPGRRPVASV